MKTKAEYAASYYERHKEKLKQKSKTYYNSNKLAARNTLLLRRFGVSSEEYDKMFKEQEGNCKICKKPEMVLNRSLAVDHCHITGKVRGLLCLRCNKGLGLFKDNYDLVKAAADYLHNMEK